MVCSKSTCTVVYSEQAWLGCTGTPTIKLMNKETVLMLILQSDLTLHNFDEQGPIAVSYLKLFITLKY